MTKTPAHCYHCGEKINSSHNYSLTVFQKPELFCCPGCRLATETIVNSGFSNYYLERSSFSEQVSQQVDLSSAELSFFDDEENQTEFSSDCSDGEKTTCLSIDGIHCAACTWLIETRLASIHGVSAISVNASTHQATLNWQSEQIKLSTILEQLKSMGYQATPLSLSSDNPAAAQQHKRALKRLGVSGLGMMQVMMFSVGLYAGAFSGIEPAHQILLRWVSLIVASCVLFYSGRTFLISAWHGLKSKHLNMDLPVSLAISGAYIVSVWATLSNTGEVYFDSVTMFIFFLTLGRFLEASGRHKANQTAQSLLKCLPQTANLILQDSEQIVPINKLEPGDIIRIKPGATLPVDGIVSRGNSSVDESLLTGEMQAKVKRVGDQVMGGCQNIEGVLEVKVSHRIQNSQLSGILQLMERGFHSRPDIAITADKVASYFIASLLILTAIVFLSWWYIAPEKALWISLSVLVVTCPCALSLATPVALTAASNALMKNGVLVTRTNVLEKLTRAQTIIFDKTGTLTQGRFSLKEVITLSSLSKEDCIALAASLEQHSEHPIARAFKTHPSATTVRAVRDIQNFPNQGIEAHINGKLYRIGKAEFSVIKNKPEPPESLELSNLTASQWILLSCEQQAIAWFQIEDPLKSEIPTLISKLAEQHFRTVMLSGDPSPAALNLGKHLGFDEVYNNRSPEQKMNYVQEAQRQGRKVIMLGDGINDAPVLAAADISFAMGEGTDLAKTSADIILLQTDMNKVNGTIQQAHKTLRIIKQNISWAVIYNTLALPLAALGFVEPYAAVIGMSASSLVVVLNSLRLTSIKMH